MPTRRTYLDPARTLEISDLIWHDASLERPIPGSWQQILAICIESRDSASPYLRVQLAEWDPCDNYTRGNFTRVPTGDSQPRGEKLKNVIRWAYLPKATLAR